MITLGRRERQVLDLMVEGNSDPEIGDALFISASTVKTHKGKLYQKLGARNGPHAIHLAYQAGLLGVGRAEDLAVVEQAREMGYRLALVPLAGGDR